MLFNYIYKILSVKYWADFSLDEKKRLSQLFLIWAILGFLSLIFFIFNRIFFGAESCILCDISMILMISIGILFALSGKISYSVTSIFTVPVFVYAYYISDFNSHSPLSDTLYISGAWLFAGLFFLLFFSESQTKIKFYYTISILTLGFQLFKDDQLNSAFSIDQLPENPLLIFSAFFVAAYLLRKKHLAISSDLSEKLKITNQSISKVLQDSLHSIAQLKAERDEEGNIIQLTVDRVNNAFESNFKINFYEVQDQKADYIFDLIFNNQFNLNELILFKRKRTKEFYASKLDRWFKVHMLIPEYNKFVLIFEDITKMKTKLQELEESKQKYKVLLEAIPDIFFVIDKDGTYEDFVVKESHLFKIEDANIIGSTIYDVGFPGNMASKIYGCIQASLANNSIESIEYSLNTPNGTFLYEMRLTKLSSQSVIAISRDITKRKTAEFSLEKALVKAEESDRLKSAFLANLSHEIRTPMNVITNFSRMLGEGDLEYEDRMEITEAISQNGTQLLNMIDNTIHLSKIETQAIEVNLQFSNINSVLRDIYNRFMILIPDSKNIKIKLKVSVPNKDFGFVTDKYLLSETLAILVDNAVKYTLQGTITIDYEMIKNEYVKFIISDTGIGIPKDEYEHVFNRFYRLENKINESTSGSGLGLNIAKHYVEMLGGVLEFESTPDVGTTFTFTLPFKDGKGFLMLVS